MDRSESESIAKQWLTTAAKTASEKDYTAHMDLISQRVSLQGLPGYDNIGYPEWAAQCKHEFDNNILKTVSYDGFKLLAQTPAQIMFKTFETVLGTDGTTNAHGIEVLLEKEEDGIWRLVQERILPADEAAHDGLLH